MIKTPNTMDIEGMYFSTLKAIDDKPIANIRLNSNENF